MKNHFLQRALLAAIALSSPIIARADVQYTTQTSVTQGDEGLKPMSTTKTYIKAGLERTDTDQTIGLFHSNETTISDKAKNQTLVYDPALKIYVTAPLNEASRITGGMGSSRMTDDQPAGLGKMILTLGAKFLGNETLMDRPVRHYATSVQTESSGCCGTGNTTMKSDVWMADVELPVFDAGADKTDWKAAYADPNSKCKIDFQRKGDIEGYEAAQKGLALKSITYDEAGHPIFSTQITSLSFAALTDDQFQIPADFKKVSRSDYDAARTRAMMAAMMPKGAGAGGDDDQ